MKPAKSKATAASETSRNTACLKREKLAPESCTSMEDLAQFISQMKFTKKTFGGVSELSVWRQMEELQKAYRTVMACQESYYRALLDEKDLEIQKLKSSDSSSLSE